MLDVNAMLDVAGWTTILFSNKSEIGYIESHCEMQDCGSQHRLQSWLLPQLCWKMQGFYL